MDLSKQYNAFARKFSDIHDIGENSNSDNRKVFYSLVDFVTSGMELLDLGCGDGLDLAHYQSMGAIIHGLDASEEFVKIAQEKLPGADIRIGLFEKTPFDDTSFDVILSKYAIQTSPDLNPIFHEVHRLLKPSGMFMFLVTHPLRQYLEKKDIQDDYFKQKIVDSHILNNAITIKEPSHTFNEYLGVEFLNNFDVLFYKEFFDNSAEQIEGRHYPGYFILKARKR
ncbi:MAG: hypothetical protein A2542_00975 [Parcubacteria group bacterium RIFOXYD2_FULL_52_8]|nr:MAG: hypothetical protein A2542_00975 [Parcubacteria group bacterium RIFOXYD2_FULL_52_8]